MKPDVVLFSTADWDNPFWTNKQHVATELARRGHRVLYVESVGLRRPAASGRDARRMLRRLRKALQRSRKVREGLWVCSPLVLPWHGFGIVRHLNRRLFEVRLTLCLRALRMKKEWLWTYNPLTSELCDSASFERCIYHCVDEIKAQPGMPVDIIQTAEEQLVRKADIVFTTSPALTEARRKWNTRTYYLPNVADYEHFSSAMSPETLVPEDLARIKEPRIGFIGAISGYKVDFGLIRKVAESLPEASVVLIGEVGEGDPWTDTGELGKVPNLWLLGPRPYAALPRYLKGISVALLPNRINEYTNSMFPMKLFEYLAAGCPVVGVNLQAIGEYRGVVSIAESPEDFVSRVAEALQGKVPPLDARLAVARQHTYAGRTARMLAMIEEAPGKGPRARASSQRL